MVGLPGLTTLCTPHSQLVFSLWEQLLRRVRVPFLLWRTLLVLCSKIRRRVFLLGGSSLWRRLCVGHSVPRLVLCIFLRGMVAPNFAGDKKVVCLACAVL